MIKRLLLASALTVAAASVSHAQDASPPPTPPGPAALPGDAPPPPPAPPGGPGAHDMRPDRGPGGPGRHGPPPPPGKGFEVKLGRGVAVEVKCGDEPIAACIDAAKPLLDKLPAMGGDGSPPRPRD